MVDDISLRMLELKLEGYCCAQIMLILALESQGKTNTDLIRAAGGLCYGVGMSGEICGALTGGACVISLYSGKGKSGEETDEKFPLMLNGLVEWFKEVPGGNYGGIRCDDILTNHPDRSICSSIVAATYDRVIQILVTHGLDPSQGKDG